MNEIARCDWLPEWARWSDLARSGLLAVSRKQNFSQKPYNKSCIDQVCSVKMAGYWPSHLVNNLYVFRIFIRKLSIGKVHVFIGHNAAGFLWKRIIYLPIYPD